MLCNIIMRTVPGSKKVAARDGYGPVYLLPVPHASHLEPSYWMIGDYHILTHLAYDLRDVTRAQAYVARIPLRFGLSE